MPLYFILWFQITSAPDCGIGNGMPSAAFSTPSLSAVSVAVVAFLMLYS